MRTGGASVLRTRYCLRALYGRLTLSRLPAIGHDLAPALFRAFTQRWSKKEESGDGVKNRWGGERERRGEERKKRCRAHFHPIDKM